MVTAGEEWAEHLRSEGFQVVDRSGENSGLHVIVVTPTGLDGGADKRREGVAWALSPDEVELPGDASAP